MVVNAKPKTVEAGEIMGRVSYLAIAPIKSGAMIEIQRARVTPAGIEGDRQFMIVERDPDENRIHHFVTQRRYNDGAKFLANGESQAALIKPEIRGSSVFLTWKGSDAIEIPKGGYPVREINVGIWGKVVNAQVLPDEVNNWVSSYLQRPLFVVKAGPSFNRDVSKQYIQNNNTLSGFQDGYGIHFITDGSLAELQTKAGSEITLKRFRPNMVIEGANAQSEYNVLMFEINGVLHFVPKPCVRCTTTTTDQDIGKVINSEPLRSLATYMRWVDANGKPGVIFGMNALPQSDGEIKVGDLIKVVALRDQALKYGAKT